MPLPPTQVKVNKGGVKLLDNCDRANYYIEELTNAALRDVGRYIVKQVKLRIHKRTGILAKNTKSKVDKKTHELFVGFKPGGFYGRFQELGTTHQPKIGALQSAVEENIDTIQKIEAQYLSAIDDELKARSLVDENASDEDDNE